MPLETYEPGPEPSKYSHALGHLKAFKNVAISLIPFVITVYGLIQYKIPTEYAGIAGAIVSYLALYAKNYLENK